MMLLTNDASDQLPSYHFETKNKRIGFGFVGSIMKKRLLHVNWPVVRSWATGPCEPEQWYCVQWRHSKLQLDISRLFDQLLTLPQLNPGKPGVPAPCRSWPHLGELQELTSPAEGSWWTDHSCSRPDTDAAPESCFMVLGFLPCNVNKQHHGIQTNRPQVPSQQGLSKAMLCAVCRSWHGDALRRVAVDSHVWLSFCDTNVMVLCFSLYECRNCVKWPRFEESWGWKIM